MALGFRIKELIMKLHSMWQEYPALQADLSASLQLMEKSL
ncbi:polyprenyl synthetase family protein, partial [Listeria monocytogenes]|nr:polyprenyl synthetase family protein [Listeria monocytogenes]